MSQQACIHRRLMEDAFEARGVVPNADLATGSSEGLKRAVQAGLGGAPMPLAAVTPVPPGTQWKRLADLDLRLTVGRMRPAETTFVGKACEALAELLVARLHAPTRLAGSKGNGHANRLIGLKSVVMEFHFNV